MDPIFDIELQDCPICRGVGAIQDEQGWSVSVACMDCGAETAHAEYRTPEERQESARRVALLKGMPYEEVARRTLENAKRFYGIE